MSSSNCCFLTCKQISQEAGHVVWYSHLLKNFPQFVVIHTVKGFNVVNEAEVDIFLELSCFLMIQWRTLLTTTVSMPLGAGVFLQCPSCVCSSAELLLILQGQLRSQLFPEALQAPLCNSIPRTLSFCLPLCSARFQRVGGGVRAVSSGSSAQPGWVARGLPEVTGGSNCPI